MTDICREQEAVKFTHRVIERKRVRGRKKHTKSYRNKERQLTRKTEKGVDREKNRARKKHRESNRQERKQK